MESEGSEDEIRSLLGKGRMGGGMGGGGEGRRTILRLGNGQVSGSSLADAMANMDKLTKWSVQRSFLTVDGDPADTHWRRPDGSYASRAETAGLKYDPDAPFGSNPYRGLRHVNDMGRDPRNKYVNRRPW